MDLLLRKEKGGDRGRKLTLSNSSSVENTSSVEKKHTTWRQEFLGLGSENLEQSTRLTAAAGH